MLPPHYRPHMPLMLPPTGDLLLGPAWTCLLPVPEPSIGSTKHKASLVLAASSLLGHKVAQDNYSPASGAPQQMPPGSEGPAGAGSGPPSYLLGPLGQSQGVSGNVRPGLGRREGRGGTTVLGVPLFPAANQSHHTDFRFLHLRVFS